MKKNSIAGVLCAVVLAFSAAAAAQDATLDRARQLIQSKQYKQAYELLAPQEQTRAGDPAYDYLLGIAAIDSGQLTRGVFALERVLAVNPDHPQARAEIARAYFLMGENRTARAEFENVRRSKPPAEVNATIDRFLNALDARERLRRTGVTGYLEASAGIDTNVNAATSNGTFAIPVFGGAIFTLAPGFAKQEDDFWAVGGGISGRYGITDSWGLVGSASFDRRRNVELSQFDTGSVNASGGVSYRKGGHEIVGAVQAQRYEVDSDRFRDAIGVVGQWRHTVGPNDQLSAYVQHTQLEYPSVAVRDADRTVVGGAWAHAYGGANAPVVYLGAYVGQEKEENDSFPHFGHDLWGLRLGGQVGLSDNVVLTGSVSYEDRQYGGADPLFLVERHDKEAIARVGLTYSIDRHWSIIPAVSYTDTRSNIVVNDYNRLILSVTARYDFR